jgi:predicted ATP-binding protein involved in virulence
VNIIFDEIELYFHPEYQRRFVSEILRRISKLEVPEITRFNLLFVTHSPFILSDIPATNVLHMENGRIIERNALTFAANVHQMLSDSFFMKSTIGDFAKYQFEQIILFYQKVRNAPERGRKDYSGTELSGSFDMEPESAYAYMKDEYQLLRDKFRFITDQIGEPVIRGVLENHIDFIEEKLSSTKEDPLTVEKERLEAKLEEINRKINNRP